MPIKSAKANQRGDSLYGLNVTGKNVQYHTYQSGRIITTFSATGGTTTTYPEGGFIYKSHTFTSTGTFSMSGSTGDISSTNLDILLVGGGGGGGYGGGGGGAGGYVLISQMPGTQIPGPSSYTVTIGTLGSGATSGNGSSGQPSTISNPSNTDWLVAVGGGKGAGSPQSSGTNPATNMAGGSGGGCGHSNGTPQNNGGPGTQPAQTFPLIPNPLITSNAGNDGGGPGPGTYTGGGGGGAGAAGGNAGPDVNDGGAGLSNTLQDGTTRFYAGGGGGGTYPSGSSVGGSSIGGGCPGSDSAGSNAVASTGSGGGGGGGGGSYYNGGNGSDGICIIRYRIG